MADVRLGLSLRRIGRAAGESLAVIALLALTGTPAAPRPAPGAAFPPSRLHVDRLENGLTLATLPLDEPDLVIFVMIVRAGARNEIEPGTEGFSRLIARLADRAPAASGRGPDPDGLARLGARVSSLAGPDAFVRTIAFMGRESLEDVLRSEADRIINLEIGPESVRREAAALAAEAGSATAAPDLRLEDALREIAFPFHPYGRLAAAIRQSSNLPAETAAAARLFKQRFYAPDHAVLLAVGDVVPDRLLALVRRYYGGWEKSNFDLAAPAQSDFAEPPRIRIAWPVPTRARLAIGFRTPPLEDQETVRAALDLLAAAAFSPSSPLFERLVRRDRTALSLQASFEIRRDSGFFLIRASAASEDGLPVLEKAIRDEVERLRTELVPVAALLAARSGRQRALLLSLETAEGKAAGLARMIGLTGDPESLARWNGLYERVGVSELREAARLGLRSAASATAILAEGEPPTLPLPAAAAAKGERE